MSPIAPNEKRFEEHIERELNSLNFCSRNYKDYDRELCLIKDEVVNFIKDTQPEKWDKLTVEEKVQFPAPFHVWEQCALNVWDDTPNPLHNHMDKPKCKRLAKFLLIPLNAIVFSI